MFTTKLTSMLQRTVYLYIGHIVTFVSQERRIKMRVLQISVINSNLIYVQFSTRCREKITQCGFSRTYRRVSCLTLLLGSYLRQNHRRIAIRHHSEILEARIRRFCTLIRSSDHIPAARPFLQLCRMSRVVFVCIHCAPVFKRGRKFGKKEE